MNLKAKTVADIENTFDYLMDVIALAKEGDKEDLENGAFKYARMILAAAEEPIQKLGMYGTVLQTFAESERLALSAQYQGALNLLINIDRLLIEKARRTT